MNITRNNVDALNTVVTIEIAVEDFQNKVEEVLKNYKKNANIPGFRKGMVPMSLVKKQYETPVKVEEINKLLQEKLSAYLAEEKLEILGNPLPVMKDVDWNASILSFDFELGLAPEFTTDLTSVKNITKYNIVADEQMIDEQVDYIQRQYGKVISQEKIEENSEITAKVVALEPAVEKSNTFALTDIRTKTNQKKFIGKKAGDEVVISTKGLFEQENKLAQVLGLDEAVAKDLDIEVTFTIEEVSTREKAELNQEFFDKLFPNSEVTSVEELKAKIKEDAQGQFAQQADQKFSDDVVAYLVEHVSFQLPAEFLKKWLQTVGETKLTAEQAEEEYTKSEKGLRYQLIEGKLITENNLQIQFEEIKAHTADLIKKQMAQFGQLSPADDEVENIVARVLSNQEEARRISEQLMQSKINKLFEEKVPAAVKEVSYKDFVKEAYGA